MLKANIDVRKAFKENGIPVWAVAAEMGVHENTVYRKLRFELPTGEKQHILNVIAKLSDEQAVND